MPKLSKREQAFTGDRAKPSGAKGTYVKKVSLSSTLGPGVKIDAGTISA